MCRWVAYAGPEIYLEDLIFHQEHSIVQQSLAATQSSWVTNGDGFGVAWYTKRTTPGLFKVHAPSKASLALQADKLMHHSAAN